MPEPLFGLRVLDLTRLLPGPFCSRILADLGAAVIKVEAPDGLDGMRHLGLNHEGLPVWYEALNRGKRGLAIDLKHEKGRDAFLRLAATADVLLEGFRPGVMDRLGLGYAAVAAANPRLVYCSLSGYGQDGPYRLRAGHDINYQAIAGVLSLSATDGRPPDVPSLPWADLAAGGLAAAMAISSALVATSRRGEGAYIDAAMLDGMLLLGMLPSAEALITGRVRQPQEQLLQGVLACYNIYATKDGGHVTVGALEPKFWHALCRLLERPDLIDAHWDLSRQAEVRRELAAIFATRTRDEWAALAATTDACLEPVLSATEALQHAQVTGRRHLYPMRSADRTWQAPGLPPGLAGQMPGQLPAAPPEPQQAPALGEHSRQILAEAGLTAAEVAALVAAGVVSA